MKIKSINNYSDFIDFICTHRYWQHGNGDRAEIIETHTSTETVILKIKNGFEAACTFAALVYFYIPITMSQYMSSIRITHAEWNKIYDRFNLHNFYIKLKASQSKEKDLANNDRVNHPNYYEDPSGIECIDIVRWRNFNIGNAIKYLWRAGLKKEEGISDTDKQIEDLKKAVWYIEDEIKRLSKE